jgi:hypothetical protein
VTAGQTGVRPPAGEASGPAAAVGPLLLWFAALGGGVAWAAHLLVGWFLVEVIACAPAATHRGQVLGLSLSSVIVLLTVALGLVAAVAALLAWYAWRRLSGGAGGVRSAGRAAGRAGFMALVGLGMDLLFLAIIVLSGVALAYLGPCTT